MKTIVIALMGAVLMVATGFAQDTKEKTIKDYMDLMRKDVRAQKSDIVGVAMGLDASQKAKFWPIYEQYEKQLTAVFDKRFANIKKYAENYDNLTDATADELVNGALGTEQERIALRKKYYGQVKSALGSKVAARFLQVESALGNLIDLQIASAVPLMP